jgi:hypothetical protein
LSLVKKTFRLEQRNSLSSPCHIHKQREREIDRGRNISVAMRKEREVIGICDIVIKIIAVSFHTSQMRMAVFVLQTFHFLSVCASSEMVTIGDSLSLTCSDFEW